MIRKQSFSFDQLINGLGPILFESIKIPFGIFGKDHRVLWVNQALAAMHQVLPEDFIGRICHKVIHKHDTPCASCPIQQVFKTGKVHIYEKRHRMPNGKEVWGEVQNYPVRGDDGEIAAVITFGFDVTDRKNRIEVLRNYSKYLSDELKGKHDKPHTVDPDESGIKITVVLSGREKQILGLVTRGYTNIQIASLLSISANTVKTHINNIFNKMGVNDRTQAAVLATRHHIV